MCDSPISIKNLNRISDPVLAVRLAEKQPYKDFKSERIFVPCGHCRSCVRARQDSLVQRVRMESLKNHFFMCTLTYNNDMLPVENVNGFKIRYADTSDVRYMIKRMRKDNAFGIPFRYLCVSEMGSLRGRPHFHILVLFPKQYFSADKDMFISECEAFASKSQHYFTFLKNWQRNVSNSFKFPVWKDLTTYVEKFYNGQLRKNYDFHYINPFLTKNGVDDCGYYVLKYMFKPSDRAVKLQQALRMNLDPVDYDRVWNKVRPRYFASIGFGYNASVQLNQRKFDKDPDIVKKLKDDISTSKPVLDYPAHFNSFTGCQSLISPYYLKNTDIYSREDRIYFWNKRKVSPGDPFISEEKTLTDYNIDSVKQERIIDYVDNLGVDSDFELFDS